MIAVIDWWSEWVTSDRFIDWWSEWVSERCHDWWSELVSSDRCHWLVEWMGKWSLSLIYWVSEWSLSLISHIGKNSICISVIICRNWIPSFMKSQQQRNCEWTCTFATRTEIKILPYKQLRSRRTIALREVGLWRSWRSDWLKVFPSLCGKFLLLSSVEGVMTN